MKVAMVTPYWHPVRGGVTTYVSGLTEELGRQGVEVHVLAREGGGAGARTIGGAPRAFARRAAEALDGIRPDAVHAHGHWYALEAALRHRRRHPRARVVFTMHTEFPDAGVLRRSAIRRLLSRADVLTAVSEDLLARTVRAFRPRTRTLVTYPGVSVRPPEPSAVGRFLREAGLPPDAPLVAFVGPLAYEAKSRGVANLVRAMAVVRRTHPDALLVVVGRGEHRKALEALAETDVPGGVRFLDSVEDPAPLLGAARVYAHVSFQEALGIAVLEAMAVGAPVVATGVGGLPELVQDGRNGLITTGEPADVARRILAILDSRDLGHRLGASGRRDAARFTWRATAKLFLEMYREGGTVPSAPP